jgi:hypothetical protein
MSPIVIECFAIRLREPNDATIGSDLVGRHTRGLCETHPDADAARLIGLIDTPLDGTALLHSTSWRWETAEGLIVTYLCCPDPRPEMSGTMVPVASRHATGDENPSRPHGLHVALSDVLHHGVDHIAWLSDHHPHLTDGVRRTSPDLWDAIRSAGRHRALQLATPGLHSSSARNPRPASIATIESPTSGVVT